MQQPVQPNNYSEWKAAIGAALKRHRDRSGRSLQSTASHAEINPELLRSIEKGSGYLTLQQLYRLSRSLNIPIGQLLLDTDAASKTGQVHDFMEAFDRIEDTELKNQIQTLVHTIVARFSDTSDMR